MYKLFVQAPKPPNEASERRLSRDKGPAPPPPPMRQDSEEKKKKDIEEKENISKDVEKMVNLTDKQKSAEDKSQINKLSQNEKMVDLMTNFKEQRNLETENRMQNELDGSEKVKKNENEDNVKLFNNMRRFETQQKLINSKSISSSKKQLGVNEKRKSAPVKPEMIEDLSKIIYKQSSLEDKAR